MLDGNRGHTFTEMVIAVALGVFMIVAIGRTMDYGISTSIDNRSRLYATTALRSELEVLRRTSFDVISALGNSTPFYGTMIGKLKNGGGVISVNSSFGSDIKKVTLTVSWTGKNGNTMSQSLVTYATRKGLNGL